MFASVNTPYHTHNDVDAPALPFTNIQNYKNYRAFNRVVVPTGQILALHATPITIVPAQGSGNVIRVEGIMAKFKYPTSGGVAYTGSNNLEFRYTDGSGAKVTTDMSYTFLNGTADAYDYAPAVTAEFTPVENAPIVVTVPSANPAAGNGYLILTVTYYVQAFP